MKLSVKDYKIIKTKKYFKTSQLFLFVNGINQSSLEWLLIKQGLKTIGFNCSKILNRTTIQTINTSIYCNIKPVIKGSTFLIKPEPKKHFLKHTLLDSFNPLFFEPLIIKFNNKIYPLSSLKSAYSLKYRETKLLFYKFNATHLKTCCRFSK